MNVRESIRPCEEQFFSAVRVAVSEWIATTDEEAVRDALFSANDRHSEELKIAA
jgi:predicted DNA-binding ribbon-helix-helix protein